MQNPIICAIDTVEIEEAKRLIQQIKPYVGMVKLGMEFFYRNGISGVEEIKKCSLPIFLDLKFYDIPNTVAGAIRGISELEVAITTIHTLAGSDVLQKAAEEIKISSKNTMLAGVTILTSIDDIKEIGIEKDIKPQVVSLAKLAQKSGLDAIVCSPEEISILKEFFGNSLKIITPGIRLKTDDAGDQKRIMTPKQAIDEGADYIVVGRPITKSDNPSAAAKEIYDSLG